MLEAVSRDVVGRVAGKNELNTCHDRSWIPPVSPQEFGYVGDAIQDAENDDYQAKPDVDKREETKNANASQTSKMLIQKTFKSVRLSSLGGREKTARFT